MDGLIVGNSGINQVTESAKGQSSKTVSTNSSVPTGDHGSFGDTLTKAIGKVNELKKDSDLSIEKFITGQENNIHNVMIKAEKAEVAMKLMIKVRNKIIDAYQEVMKMQV
jgi:flagellar hook-basal body complex protein FliE